MSEKLDIKMSFTNPNQNRFDVMGWLQAGKPVTRKMTAKEQREALQQKRPDIFKVFAPRIYKNVDRYGDYQLPAIVFGSAFVAGEADEKLFQSDTFLKQVLTGHIWASNGAPMFFVTEELLHAAMETQPPTAVDWSTMKLPFESAVFVFPRGAVEIPNDEGPCHFAIYSRVRARTYRVPQIKLDLTYMTESFTINTFSEKHYYDYMTNYVQPYIGLEINDLPLHDEFCLVLSENESAFNSVISRIVFNLLLIMNEKPELREVGQRVGMYKKREGVEVWTPNVLGRKYYVRRHNSGNGTSPRMHWRRGHWRKQPYGAFKEIQLSNGTKGREFQAYKDIWIEPMLIAAETTVAE